MIGSLRRDRIGSEDCLVCREQRLDVAVPGGHLVMTRQVVAFHLPPWPPPAEDVYLGYLMVTQGDTFPGSAISMTTRQPKSAES